LECSVGDAVYLGNLQLLIKRWCCGCVLSPRGKISLLDCGSMTLKSRCRCKALD
ncbi:hypothetical protein T05_14676, partial [Trichinella murrelli]